MNDTYSSMALIARGHLMDQLLQAKRSELLLMGSLRTEWKEREKFFKLNGQFDQLLTIQNVDEEVFDVTASTDVDLIIRIKVS